jgi:hypothetical protein
LAPSFRRRPARRRPGARGWSPRRAGTHRVRVETFQRPHARQLARRAPSWPRTRPSTRHPDGCPGSANSVQCPRPPAARHCRPATGVQDRRRAEVPGRRDRPRDPAGPRRRHPPAAAIRRSGRWSSSARRGGARVSTVWRRGAVGLAVRFRDRATDATTMPTIVTCKTKPPSSAATPGPSDGAVMGCGACLSTACLHPTHCGVFHVEHVRNARRSR